MEVVHDTDTVYQIMKNKLFMILCMMMFSYSYAQDTDTGKWIKENNIEAIELYCRQKLFFTYGGYATGDMFISPIDNETAGNVIQLLQHGAERGNANCQFMLGCILSGNKTIRGRGEDDNEVDILTPKDYKYLDDKKAEMYFDLYLNNPKMDRERGAFGYSFEQIAKLIRNAYPKLMDLYNAKNKN